MSYVYKRILTSSAEIFFDQNLFFLVGGGGTWRVVSVDFKASTKQNVKC